MTPRPVAAPGRSDPGLGRVALLEALLDASYRLSRTVTTEQAADELAEISCVLTGADGAHVYLPDQVGGPVWSNANEARTPAARGTVSFDVRREAPDLVHCVATGQDLFVTDGLAADAPRRPLRVRYGAASLWFTPLLDLGVLVLWWEQPRAAPPEFDGDWPAFVNHFAQALRRRIVTTTLRDLTRTDPLTGLDNRRALLQVLESIPAGGGLLMIDLDHFKRVNDTLGHRHGDQVLRGFARLLREHAPQALSVARYGGEEFAVVFASDGRNAGEQTFTELRRAWQGQGLAFSAGLAEHRAGGSTEETLEAADRALYRAKQTGRDRLVHAADVAWTEPTRTSRAPLVPPRSAHEDAPLTLDQLDEALARALVTAHYQPIVDTRTGRVAAVEALARMTHPDTGRLLLPDAFLPLAERTGRVGALDRQVAEAAITQVATWRNDPLMAELTVAVNVSVDHLDEQDLPAYLIRTCRLAGLPTAALTVEITETLRSVTGRGHEGVVQQLREAGLQVALDDFGTSFSALSYLLRFAVTGVKIDQSFTAALNSDRGQHLARGILSTAQAMGLRVVAEGVETPEQRDWLLTHECPYLQGYLLSPPVPSHALPAAVRLLNLDAADTHA